MGLSERESFGGTRTFEEQIHNIQLQINMLKSTFWGLSLLILQGKRTGWGPWQPLQPTQPTFLPVEGTHGIGTPGLTSERKQDQAKTHIWIWQMAHPPGFCIF